MRPSRPGLGRDFRQLWTAATVSYLGDGIYASALPLLAASLTRNAALVGLVTSINSLPWVFFGLISGTLVDRWDRLRTMWLADCGRFLIVAGLAAAVAAGYGSIPLLLAAVVVLGVGQTLFDTASQAVIPMLVTERGQPLEGANGRLSVSQTASEQFTGPPVGGFLFGLAAAVPFAADAASFGVSSLIVRCLARRQRRSTTRVGSSRSSLALVSDLRRVPLRLPHRAVRVAGHLRRPRRARRPGAPDTAPVAAHLRLPVSTATSRRKVVRVLLDHSSTQMTAHYAKPTDQTVRRRREQATRVNISGERVTIDPDGPLGQAQWAKTRYGIATQTLPNGYCGLPVQRQCPHANSCLTCPVFITGPEFLPELREQQQRTLTLITTARDNGHVRVTEMNEQVAANLDHMITELEGIGPDEQQDAANAG